MNEETFQRKLAELVAEIATLPEGERGKLEMLAQETRERHKQLRETVSSLQESIDFVRLSIKYMLFDLEATRRENSQLRKMLDDQEGGSEERGVGSACRTGKRGELAISAAWARATSPEADSQT